MAVVTWVEELVFFKKKKKPYDSCMPQYQWRRSNFGVDTLQHFCFCMVKYHRFFCEVITHNTDAAGTMDDGRWCLMSHLVYVLMYIPAG